ncbi:MAG: hypothetical protein V4665_03075 [Patescibacteria group bacterium]
MNTPITTSDHKPVLKRGIQIAATDDNPIAWWHGRREGSLFAKVFFAQRSDTSEGGWEAVTNQNYKGEGMIVFIKQKPAYGQQLTITNVSNKTAFADVC